MEKIPTAKDFYLKRVFPTSFEIKPDEVELWFDTDGHAKENVNIMIEFAKLHVEQALKEASEEATINKNKGEVTARTFGNVINGTYSINQQSILNSYSLDNIK